MEIKRDEPRKPVGLFSGKKSDNIKKLVIIAGFVGIALIFLSSFLKPKESSGQQEEVLTITAAEYTESLENSLTQIVSSIQGAGETQVMVTLENDVQTVYATEERTTSQGTEEKTGDSTAKTQQSKEGETNYIIVKDANGAERALEITQVQPTVKGVVVVCAGGDDPVVQQRIMNAVTTALNLSSKRVCVIQGTKQN